MKRLPLLFLLTPASVFAQAPDTSDWACELCPFNQGVEPIVEAGIGVLSDTAFRYGNGTGLDSKGAYLQLGGQGGWSFDGTSILFRTSGLGLDNRAAALELNRGPFTISLEAHRVPYRLYDSTVSVFRDSGDTLLLPGSWTRAATTGSMVGLTASLAQVPIGADRDTVALSGTWQVAESLVLDGTYRRINVSGTRVVGGAWYTQASMLPKRYDHETRELELGLRYSAGRISGQLGYYGATFNSHASALTWENPFTALPGGDRGRSAVTPDNDFDQVSFGVGFAPGVTTRFSFSGAFGNLSQDDAFVAYTLNPALASAALPRGSLGGDVDTTNLRLSLSSRPYHKVQTRVTARYDARDSDTPIDTYERVIVDSVTSGEPETNVSYDYDRRTVDATFDYSYSPTLRLSGVFEFDETGREFEEVRRQREFLSAGRVHYRATDFLTLRGRAGNAKREIDAYNVGIVANPRQNPLLRKYHLAYRYREFADLNLDLNVPRSSFDVTASYRWTDDSYSKSEIGMLGGREQGFVVDVGWAASDKVQVYGSVSGERMESLQAGSSTFGAPDWRVNHHDAFWTMAVGLTASDWLAGIDVTFDFVHTNGETEITTERTGASRASFPLIESTSNSLNLSLVRQFATRVDGFVRVFWEEIESDDWALDGVEPDTVPTLLGLGEDPFNYNVVGFVAGARYRF